MWVGFLGIYFAVVVVVVVVVVVMEEWLPLAKIPETEYTF